MATANQIYLMVNDAAAEALGSQAISAKDTASLVSLGGQVLSSTDNKDAFYKALCDRIGRTAIAIRDYEAKNRSVKRDDMEWGIFYQKISFRKREAVENTSWSETQASPYDIEQQTEAVQKLFSVMGTWSYEDSIPDYQLFTAFTSASAMGAYISGIYVNMRNALAVDEEDTANLAVSTYMAGALIKGTNMQKRDLLGEYNIANDTSLTATEALKTSDFLKFASREIMLVTKKLKNMSVLYNADGMPRFTPADKMVVEVLSEFATATATYLEADTYHKELVALPKYEEVNYWQGAGTTNAFDDVSKIHITNAELATDDNLTGTIEQGGIIAFVHDYDAVASIVTRFRDYSKFNERSERLNIMAKADKGYAVDLSENGVVFYLGET